MKFNFANLSEKKENKQNKKRMSQKLNPKLIITNYYQSLVQKIDISTEESLQYWSASNCYDEMKKMRIDKLNRARDEKVRVLKHVENETIKLYEERMVSQKDENNKENNIMNEVSENQTDKDSIENLNKLLFANKYAFLCKPKKILNDGSFHLVVIDMYLTQAQIDYIQ